MITGSGQAWAMGQRIDNLPHARWLSSEALWDHRLAFLAAAARTFWLSLSYLSARSKAPFPWSDGPQLRLDSSSESVRV